MIATKLNLVSLLPLLGVVHVLAAPSNSNSYSSSYGSGDSSDASGSSSYSSSSNSGSGYDSNYGSSGYNSGGSYNGGGGEIIAATTIVEATTLTAASSYQTTSYGSGSSTWGSSGDLQSCLNTCQAQFGSGSSSSYGSSSSSSSYGSDSGSSSGSSSYGSGTSTSSASTTTHTIIVAPTKGVLRFVPFAVEGNQGDSIEFVWGAGPHTATLSDGQNVCNKSTSSDAFDSGKLNATATFPASVFSSAPQFHYCTVMTHCQQGMFGLINPPTNDSISLASTALNASSSSSVATKTTSSQGASSTAGSGVGCSSVDCWVSNWSLSGSGPQATASAVKAACDATSGSWAWGGQWDFSSLLSDAVTRENVVENVLYSRLMISMNPSMLVAGSAMNNLTAAPPLDQFVAAAVNASSTSATLSGVETVSAASAGASASVSAAAAAADGASSGADRLSSGMVAMTLGLLGVGVAHLL